MFKNKQKELEAKAKAEDGENFVPTEELKADEEKPEYRIPWTALIIVGALLILIGVCIAIIYAYGGPVNK